MTSRCTALAPTSAATSPAPSALTSPDDDLGALGRQPARDGGADAARAAGHQCLSSLEPHRRAAYGRGACGLGLALIDCAAVADAIPIIGGTGALGYGLGAEMGACRPPGRDRLARRRTRRRERRARSPSRRPTPRSRGWRTARPNAGALGRARGPVPSPVGEPEQPARGARAGQILVDCTVPLAAAVSGKATRTLGVWQGSAAQQAQEMVPDGVTVVAALHTVGAPTLGDREAKLDEDVLVCGDRKADKAKVARADRGDRRTASGQRRAARDGADRRAADGDDDLDQRPLQDPRRARITGLPEGDHWA